MDDEQTLDNDDVLDGDEGTGSAEGSDGGDNTGAPPKDQKGTKDSGNSDKRVNDLMSKWQSAEAEKTRLAQELAALKGSGSAGDGEGQKSGNGSDSQVSEFLSLVQTQARQSLYGSDPRLAKYGIEVTAIEGTSAEEMTASFKRVQALVDKVEASARTELLKQHGLDPDIGGGSAGKPRDFASMSDKEILEIGDRVLGRS